MPQPKPLLTLPTNYNGPRDQPLEMTRAQWLAWMRQNWAQGEHIAIVGRTGRGKTTLARELLLIRSYVAALAIKRTDDTVESFTKSGYRIIRKWPPRYGDTRVVVWARPKNLDDDAGQGPLIKSVLNDAYINGGWAVFVDDLSHVVSMLGLGKSLAKLFNQARSNHASIVSAFTQPSSMTMRIPSEAWKQVRFHLIFYYRPGKETDAIAENVGYRPKQLEDMMANLRRVNLTTREKQFDFLCFDDLTDSVIVVRS